jgi:hypothetical protein
MRKEELEDARRRIAARMKEPQSEESLLQLVQELSAIEGELLRLGNDAPASTIDEKRLP